MIQQWISSQNISKSERRRILNALENGTKAPSVDDIAKNRMHVSKHIGKYPYEDHKIPTISDIRPLYMSGPPMNLSPTESFPWWPTATDNISRDEDWSGHV
ncbi:hypothetical protein L1887_24213 [Cichorium endivia]|nr:hypothetical protein L1887_24213 [Cichorium endivia]